MKTKRVECGKCYGRGTIHHYAHIANGVCFACGGLGYKVVRVNYKPSIKYGITIIQDGSRMLCYWMNARTESEALRKATATNETAEIYMIDGHVGTVADFVATQ